VTYDPDHDLAYLRLVELPDDAAGVAHSVSVESEHRRGEIVLDFNLEGHLVGLEVFNARGQMPPELFSTS
jgi:uncharacterized protein YuzE